MKFKNFNSILLSIFIGTVISIYIFKQYDILEAKTVNKLLFVSTGVYNSNEELENNMIKVKNYIIEQDGNLYKTYVGITSSNSNFEKLKNYYNKLGLNVTLEERTINNEELNDYVVKYDAVLNDTDEEKVISLISEKVILKYKEVMNGKN